MFFIINFRTVINKYSKLYAEVSFRLISRYFRIYYITHIDNLEKNYAQDIFRKYRLQNNIQKNAFEIRLWYGNFKRIYLITIKANFCPVFDNIFLFREFKPVKTKDKFLFLFLFFLFQSSFSPAPLRIFFLSLEIATYIFWKSHEKSYPS